MDAASGLPAPGADEQALSDALSAQIRQAIADHGGAIPFSHFMELCLYAPGLGYYSAGLQKFGAAGDFVTAPEISPLFGRCIAKSCAEVLDALGGGDILEFGAGSGRMAVDLLSGLEASGCLPRRYFILERSAELKQRQQQLFQSAVPELSERVVWIDRLPEPGFRGVILGNEVLDAMAVERFRWKGGRAEQFYVVTGEDGFTWQAGPVADEELKAEITRIAHDCALPDGYVSELNTALQPWLRSVAACLQGGMILMIDYGYPRHEYYHEQRSSGTLLCHYRQRAHADVLRWPGLQDITAHVDFTAVAEAAVAAGLAVSGYTTQAYFLLDCGLDDLLQSGGTPGDVDYLRRAQQAKTLILPGEMGERFKCIALTRELDMEIPGFRMQDFRHRL